MKKIHIVTDSTADLIENYMEQYSIHVVPLTIHIDGQTYMDGIDIQPETFIEKMNNSKELPKSSQPATGVFKELYDKLGADGSEIISIHMTGGMSGTVKSAEAAAAMTDAKVTVIDSMYISHALTFQVVEAAQMASEGKSVQEIVERLSVVRQNTKLYVVVDMLDNLVKGGRIGKGKAMIGSLLNIKPIATLQDGVYTPVAKARSHKQVASHLFKAFTEETKGKIVRSIGLSHANGLAMAEPLLKKIEETGWKDVKFSFTSPIISTHTGEGAIGFMYYAE
ncbi:DegV family protein [Sporosarcina saromensis]|uniref:DegV family protein n=1 Tax=Sporosarcina saromensis TaxID=359365 RepID=A0ABU4G9T5_9BACL|nr:DegV family protein [Sporosarcina saromensis]MDW0113739.1 DegV family protein [Sporosarcina saromensis]